MKILSASVAFLSAFLLFLTEKARADVLSEVRITEFLAVNDDGVRDEDGDRSDWIEIWNASGVTGELTGWYLTDDPANLTKWSFPASRLTAGERMLVFASDKNRQIADSELHTNFRLSAATGGYLALVRPDGRTIASEFLSYPAQSQDVSFGVQYDDASAVTLLAEGAAAHWLVPTGEVTGWQEISFDDSEWFSGTTGIGYDSSDDYAPHIGAGDDLSVAMRNVNQTVFIRVPFEVTDPLGTDEFTLRMKWEDGFAAYLNGIEITRQRAPEILTFNSGSDPAGGRDEADAVTYFDYKIESADLRLGKNVLAIHGLNQSLSSSDFLISPLVEAVRKLPGGETLGFFTEPSPGEANGTTRYDGLVADTKFSLDRGTYEEAFDLAITTETPDAIIRYTTDGTLPSESNGTIYGGSLQISKTTTLRVMAYREGYFSTNVDTQTYIFPADVVNQPNMRTAITGNPIWGLQMLDSINALPTLALSFDGDDINRTEVPISVELLNFENGDHQIDAGAIRVGGRFTDYAKHSIRLHLRSRYGPKRLEYPVFDDRIYSPNPVTSFDALDVRAGNQDMVHRGAYLSNLFADDSMKAMGQPAPHGRFVHLYFNGEYRGLYHLRERFHAAMLADYFPGKEEEFTTVDGVNRGNFFSDGIVQNGPADAWSDVLSAVNGPTPYQDLQPLLDVENLIDFMLLWTSGSCESEFRAVGSPENGVPFVFHMKDADGFLRPPDLVDNDPRNRTFAYVHLVTHPGPMDAMLRLRSEGDPDFQMLLADRIHKHFFNGGALTPAEHISRLQTLVDAARLPYLAETARWGIHDGDTPNRNPSQWEAYQQDILQNQFPILAASQISKFQAAGMYPDFEAPLFSQHGDSISSRAGVTMSTGESQIYFTLDGSDPRESGGEISPMASLAIFDALASGPRNFLVTGDVWKYLDDGSDQGSSWRAVAFDDSGWASGPSELGYGENDQATDLGFVDIDPATPGNQRNATTYFRRKFEVENLNTYSDFTLSLKYDDGAAIFLNGVEIVRTDNLSSNAAFDTYADGNSPDESAYFDFTIDGSFFIAGENTIAVEIHNAAPNSGDLSFDLRLTGNPPAEDRNVTEVIEVSEPLTLNARSYDNVTGEWSALTSAFFTVGSVPASSENLVISEIHYRPSEPTTTVEIAVSTDRDDFEFIELMNISSTPIEMEGVAFTDGISFSFLGETIIAPGGRLVLVRDSEAFAARYGAHVDIGGVYEGRLSNDGERLVVANSRGMVIDFIYDDSSPWPSDADGEGPSLYLVSPEMNLNPSDALSWASHRNVGGGPGLADFGGSGGFDSWKLTNHIGDISGDRDGDGLTELMEYALGTSPDEDSSTALPRLTMALMNGEIFPVFEYVRDQNVSDVIYEIQSSTDLKIWSLASFIETQAGVFVNSVPIGADSAQRYFRLSIQLVEP